MSERKWERQDNVTSYRHRFLDRFVYKNPKQKERDHGGSVMQVCFSLIFVSIVSNWSPHTEAF